MVNAIALVLLALAVQEAPKPRILAALSIEEKGGQWLFVVRGTTDLPSGTVLRAWPLALNEVPDHRGGTYLEEEALTYDAERVYKLLTVADGKIDDCVFVGRRRPYSLRYRVRLQYAAELQQTEEIARQAGLEDFEVTLDMRRGTDADLEQELKQSQRELNADLDEVHRLFNDLRATFLEQQKKPDPEAWEKWSKGWLQSVMLIEERNDERWALWIAWLERQGRIRINGFVKRFHMMHRECSAALKERRPAHENLVDSLEQFLSYYDEAREILAADTPLDLESVRAAFLKYEGVFRRMRELSERRDADAWRRERGQLEADARHALLTLAMQRVVPKRGYERVQAIAADYLKLRALADAILAKRASDAEEAELVRLAAEHDARLRDFRAYAGLR